MSPGSVLVFDDIARWWERSEDGFQVVDRILELIEQHSSSCFFIVNVNRHAFQVMNRIRRMEGFFLETIDCGGVDTSSLKQIILLRHRSTGLRFVYQDRFEDDMAEWRLAGMFGRLLRDCRGNVAWALRRWISCIHNLDGDEITIRIPGTSSLAAALSALQPGQNLLLVQILLHGKLNLKRLSGIAPLDSHRLAEEIGMLKRAGLIRESLNAVYQVNPFIEHDLLQFYRQKGVL